MPRLRAAHGAAGDRPIERDEPATVADGERQQVQVRQLARPVDAGRSPARPGTLALRIPRNRAGTA